MRQPLGRFRKGPGKTALVATRDDDGTLVTKGLQDNLDESLSRRQRRTLKFLLLDQPIDERMRRPNEDQRRLLVWFAKAIGRQCHGNRDACGFESEPRRQLDGAGGSIARWTEQHVEPIGNAVVVRVAQPSVIGVEIRQRQLFLGVRTGTRRERSGPRAFGARNLHDDRFGAGGGDLDTDHRGAWVRKRALGSRW